MFFGGFLIPWSEEIIKLMLGPSYLESSSVFSVMLIFAAFRSLGIFNTSMLLATCETKVHAKIGVIWMGFSMLGSYFILAPKNSYMPGLQLGSLGLAIKMLLFSILYANLISWWISRSYGWKFDWMYQITVLGGAFSCSWFSFELVQSMNSLITLNLFCNGLLTLLFYSGFFTAMAYWMPWVLGVSRQELKDFFLKLVNLSRA
jgi:O-antigen/teichoic acid export membrane protein